MRKTSTYLYKSKSLSNVMERIQSKYDDTTKKNKRLKIEQLNDLLKKPDGKLKKDKKFEKNETMIKINSWHHRQLKFNKLKMEMYELKIQDIEQDDLAEYNTREMIKKLKADHEHDVLHHGHGHGSHLTISSKEDEKPCRKIIIKKLSKQLANKHSIHSNNVNLPKVRLDHHHHHHVHAGQTQNSLGDRTTKSQNMFTLGGQT